MKKLFVLLCCFLALNAAHQANRVPTLMELAARQTGRLQFAKRKLDVIDDLQPMVNAAEQQAARQFKPHWTVEQFLKAEKIVGVSTYVTKKVQPRTGGFQLTQQYWMNNDGSTITTL